MGNWGIVQGMAVGKARELLNTGAFVTAAISLLPNMTVHDSQTRVPHIERLRTFIYLFDL